LAILSDPPRQHDVPNQDDDCQREMRRREKISHFPECIAPSRTVPQRSVVPQLPKITVRTQ
jgi:hypothetical protein